MELLYGYSVMKGTNYFLSNFRSLRIYGFISFRMANNNVYTNSFRVFGTAKTFSGVESQNSLTSVRAYSEKGVFNRLKKISSILRRRNERTILAMHLYSSMDNINFEEFYDFLEIPDTFNSWFVLMELHLWMLLSQLMDKERDGLKLRNEVIQLFWYEVETRINTFKLNTPKILRKQLSEFSGRLPITLLVYDEGLLSTDYVLAGAIWYKFFDKHPTDPRKLEILVRYIRYQIQHMSLLNLRNYKEVQKISQIWLPITPHVDAVMSMK